VASTSPFQREIVIIGGGLSGCLVAAQLLRRAAENVRVTVIERKAPLGRGVAYGTECPDHLLNVPAGKISVLPDEPDHFFNWITERVGRAGYPTGPVARTDFLPRWIFGEYVYAVMEEARARAKEGVTLRTVLGETNDLEEANPASPNGRHRVILADGNVIEADRVVLAIGNLPGEYPIRRSLRIYHHRRYVHVPWRERAVENIGSNEQVLLVGAGLTAIDMIVQLDRQGHRGTIHALSRRGLRPQMHETSAPYPAFLDNDALPKTVRETVRRVRQEIAVARKQGIGWRPVLDSVRPFSQALWRNFSWEERARFMRHLRPYWDIHRHRLAPVIAERVARIQAEGRLKFYAGRLESLTEKPEAIEAVFRLRGSEERKTLQVAKVINCTGPRTDYSKYQHPLLINLLARSLIDHDPLAVGLNASPAGEVFRYRNGPVGWLFTLGAPLQGVLWESTAVPEIRAQAAILADKLLSS
jgi:uncharacterized NAD(P)/FAD-binding protein YdhS